MSLGEYFHPFKSEVPASKKSVNFLKNKLYISGEEI